MPPVRAGEAVSRASREGSPTTPDNPTARTSWRKANTAAMIRNLTTLAPPVFSILKLAAKPMVQKYMFWKKDCRVVSKSNSMMLALRNIVETMEKIKPPITGAGIQYRVKKRTLLRTNVPISRTTMAKPVVCTMFMVSAVMSPSPYFFPVFYDPMLLLLLCAM